MKYILESVISDYAKFEYAPASEQQQTHTHINTNTNRCPQTLCGFMSQLMPDSGSSTADYSDMTKTASTRKEREKVATDIWEIIELTELKAS